METSLETVGVVYCVSLVFDLTGVLGGTNTASFELLLDTDDCWLDVVALVALALCADVGILLSLPGLGVPIPDSGLI